MTDATIRTDVAGRSPASVVMPRGWIVELEPGVWLAERQGDPGRTCDRENAKVYGSEEAAIRGKARARGMRPFRAAVVRAVYAA